MSTTFLGIKASQAWEDFPIWETFFNEFPVRTFVELGTDNGGMSIFFALQCIHRGIRFYTFDNQKWMNFESGAPKALNLGASFRHVDLFGPDGMREMEEIINYGAKPLALFFDDGDKPREWKTYAPLTSPGDFCIVHDWGTEFMPSDLLDVPVERILTEMCDVRTVDWKSMWFRRV